MDTKKKRDDSLQQYAEEGRRFLVRENNSSELHNILVAVYGTLKRGYGNHMLLANSIYIADGYTEEQKKELENAEKRKIQEKMEAKIERESRKIVTPGGTGLRASGASSVSGGGSRFRTPSSKRPGTGGKTPRRFGL